MQIVRNESNASRRVVPIWCVQSDGTTPATGEAGGQPQWMLGGVFRGNTSGTLSAWSAARGQYFVVLTQAETDTDYGPGVVRYNSGTALETETPILILAANSYDSTRLGLTALPNAAAEAAGGLITAGTGTNQISLSNGSVGLRAQVHSGATVAGASFVTINPGTYSDVTFSAGGTAPSLVTLAPGTHSSATIQGVTRTVNLTTNDDKTGYTILAGTYSNVTFSAGGLAPSLVTLAPGTHSSATIQGVTRAVNLTTNDDKTGYTILAGTYSNVTFSAGGTAPSLVTIAPTSTVTVSVNQDKTGYGLAAGNYSGVTISGVTATNVLDKTGYGLAAGDYSGATVGINNIAPGSYSGVTVGSRATILAGGIIAASFGASAIDAAALATDAGQEIADRLLARRISGGADSGRTVAEALYVLRNRVEIGDSVGTIYQTDDTTSAWTMSVTTAAFPLGQVNPA